MSHSGRAALLVVTALSVAACERPTPEGGTTVTAAPVVTDDSTTTPATTAPTTEPTSSTSSSVPATTVPLSSPPQSTTTPPTVAVSTTTPATTEPTEPASPSELVLAFDGIRPFDFGRPDTEVVPALTALLGDPVSDVAAEYPTPDEGQFVNDAEEGFVAPFGRSVCFANGLCVEFGAGSPDALQFVGWDFAGDDAAGLATEAGITVGSKLSDHTGAITFDPLASCFQVAFGAADGVDVTLLSDDGVFAAPNEDGTEMIVGDPDPTLVTVRSLSAGDLPVQIFADC